MPSRGDKLLFPVDGSQHDIRRSRRDRGPEGRDQTVELRRRGQFGNLEDGVGENFEVLAFGRHLELLGRNSDAISGHTRVGVLNRLLLDKQHVRSSGTTCDRTAFTLRLIVVVFGERDRV